MASAVPKTIVTMRLSGGLPILDFTNTVDCRIGQWGPDLLGSYADLLVWAGRVKLLDASTIAHLGAEASASPQAAATALDRAKRLREAVCDVLAAIANGRQADGVALALVSEEARNALARRSLKAGETGFVWRWLSDDDLNTVTLRLALEAAEFLVEPDRLSRLRECHGPRCGWLFVDETKNGRRRWCSEATCGVHSRVLRYRGKAGAAGAP